MTTPHTHAKTAQVQGRYVFSDPPEYKEAQMFNFDNLAASDNAHFLKIYLGNPETTLVVGERYLALQPTRSLAGVRQPDPLVAFGVDPAAYKASNAYVISEQGKPPDFVLEIAGPITGHIDVTDKRRDYEALGIPEYWRFDKTGQFHGARLAGDRLVGWEYAALEITELPNGGLQGYSRALNLNIRWEEGELGIYDPATGLRILALEEERLRARTAKEKRVLAEARADAAQEEHVRAEALADAAEARTRADSAEARIREMEEQLRRQNP